MYLHSVMKLDVLRPVFADSLKHTIYISSEYNYNFNKGIFPIEF